jgi:hypothetical protein
MVSSMNQTLWFLDSNMGFVHYPTGFVFWKSSQYFQNVEFLIFNQINK